MKKVYASGGCDPQDFYDRRRSEELVKRAAQMPSLENIKNLYDELQLPQMKSMMASDSRLAGVPKPTYSRTVLGRAEKGADDLHDNQLGAELPVHRQPAPPKHEATLQDEAEVKEPPL